MVYKLEIELQGNRLIHFIGSQNDLYDKLEVRIERKAKACEKENEKPRKELSRSCIQ